MPEPAEMLAWNCHRDLNLWRAGTGRRRHTHRLDEFLLEFVLCFGWMCYVLLEFFVTSKPLRLVALEDSSPKRPTMCRLGFDTVPT